MSHTRATVLNVHKFLTFVSDIVPIGAVYTKLFFFVSSLYNISSIFLNFPSNAGRRPTRRNLVGCFEGALGLGCRSWAPHGVPWTEPSAPCCVAAAPELSTECRGQSVENLRESQVFLAVATGLVNECRGRSSPARFQGARAA